MLVSSHAHSVSALSRLGPRPTCGQLFVWCRLLTPFLFLLRLCRLVPFFFLATGEDSFLQKLISIRAEEMRFVRNSAYTRAWSTSMMQTGPLLMSLLAFITLGLTTDNLEAQSIFSSLTLVNLLRMPLMQMPICMWKGANRTVQTTSRCSQREGKHEGSGRAQDEPSATTRRDRRMATQTHILKMMLSIIDWLALSEHVR